MPEVRVDDAIEEAKIRFGAKKLDGRWEMGERERERERERESMCMCVCVYMCEREREKGGREGERNLS